MAKEGEPKRSERFLGLDMRKRSRRWGVIGALLGAALGTGIYLAAFTPASGFVLWAGITLAYAISGGLQGFVASKILQPDIVKETT